MKIVRKLIATILTKVTLKCTVMNNDMLKGNWCMEKCFLEFMDTRLWELGLF